MDAILAVCGDGGAVAMCEMHANAAFAVVLAWVVVPNGQEWYQDRFGMQGRMGGRWAVWSTGGRMVTLALIFLMMSKDITGWGNSSPDIQFGLGFHPDSFTLEAADFLDRSNEIKGNILNTSMHQGDLLIWKSAAKRKTYVDGRYSLFPRRRFWRTGTNPQGLERRRSGRTGSHRSTSTISAR